jgi:hypothetical protein
MYEILFITRQLKHGDDAEFEVKLDKFESMWDL